MDSAPLTPRRLRPSLGRRLTFLILSVGLLALSVTALAYGSIFGLLGVLLAGFATVNGAIRMWAPRSYATDLDEEGFTTFDYRGRPVHQVRWAEVAHLTIFNGNGLRGPGTAIHLAWRCEPRRPGKGRQPGVRGGRNSVGEEFDGALPDPYLGIEPMLELFKSYADASDRARAAGPRMESDPRQGTELEPF